MIDLQEEIKESDEAFALDWYKDNGYTSIGRAVYDIKYGYIKNHVLPDKQLNDDIKYLVDQLLPFTEDIDIILPIPSFNPNYEGNPEGELKIMYMIAQHLGRISGKVVSFSVLKKISSSQAKDSQLNESDYISTPLPAHLQKVLLIDDLFGEGNTARYTIRALRAVNPNIFIRFISLTKNKYGGIHKHYDCRISQYNAYLNDNGNESIQLYFYKDNKGEQVRIWKNHSQFQDVKEVYDKGDFDRVLEFSIYRNQNGYWQIDDN